MDIFLHVGNVLYVVSYSVRDILTLRVVTVIAILSLIGYYITTGLWVAIAWSVVFMLVNMVQVYRLLVERRPAKLTLDERRLYGLAFAGVDERQFKRLVSIGEWQTIESGEQFVTRGEANTAVRVILQGRACVSVGDTERAALGPGQFVGEGGFLTGAPATASVRAQTAMRVLSLPSRRLTELLDARTELKSAVQRIIAADLVSKLRMTAAPVPA